MPVNPVPAARVEAPDAPRSRADLFWSFTWLALQGFGGVLAVVQRELVEKKRWMTREQFVEDWAVAQIMPGPNVVNLSMMIGDRCFGLSGALAALAGMLTVPTVVVLLLAALYSSVADAPLARDALRGMGAVAAGLILAMAFKMLGTLRDNLLGPWLCALLGLASLVAIAVFRLPLAWIVIGLGLLGWGLARWRVAVVDARAARTGEGR